MKSKTRKATLPRLYDTTKEFKKDWQRLSHSADTTWGDFLLVLPG